MMEYNFASIEKKWQEYWQENKVYKATIDSNKPKYYVLTMFPYPSGAGLHVGHPLGYVAADIYARFKKHAGFEVLHPMGFDAFGLPAEQYAVKTGQHPAKTTEVNIERYKDQLKQMGLSYDWDREVNTSEPEYYKFTQWIFLQLFNSWYSQVDDKALPIDQLIQIFEKQGNADVKAAHSHQNVFKAEDWNNYSESEKAAVLQDYRLAYISFAEVNWCEALGTVLANDEVINGLSERGGHPVTKKKMRQWYLRITAYAERLLQGLEKLDWPEPLKLMQQNWIGKSQGAELDFVVKDHDDLKIKVFTTRPDTIYGVTFMVVAPESDLINTLVTEDQQAEIENYIAYVKSRSERDRMAEVNKVTGCFTGSYAINPFSNESIPIYTSEYVLASYGTGAIMAVPAHDSRDYAFAKKFDLNIRPVVDGGNIEQASYDAKDGKLINSDQLNGLEVKEAIVKAIDIIEAKKIGTRKINYKLRDAGFSRQRYWGEPFPIQYKDGIAEAVPESELPVTLPKVDSYKPTGTGESPIAAIEDWVYANDGFKRETDTMPGYAGSSWYWLRYMSPKNTDRFVDQKEEQYWQNVDLYIGGSEHAVGHLLYSRMWQKVLFDLGLVSKDEPFQKMINQGMIQGNSAFVYRLEHSLKNNSDIHKKTVFLSAELGSSIDVNAEKALESIQFVTQFLANHYHVNADDIVLDAINGMVSKIHIDIEGVALDDSVSIEYLQSYFKDHDLITIAKNDKFFTQREVEKMSKSKYNVVTPDDIISKYGADTFRMYEMFLGPVTDSKPWNTKGIDGVYKFIRKFWNLFHNKQVAFELSDEQPSKAELKILHTCIQKVQNDIAKLSFNTCVSHFMICVNDLQGIKCHKIDVLKPLVVLISPFAPHIAEELWSKMGNNSSITSEPYPICNESFLVEDEIEYPIMVNGKMRAKITLPSTINQQDAIAAALALDAIKKWTEGKEIKKMVFVPKRIINLVVA